MVSRLSLLIGSGALAMGLVAAPIAQAQTLEAIYADMVTANRQQPCGGPFVAPTWTCLTSTNGKFRLTMEVAPMIEAMPATPRGPVENAQDLVRMLRESADEWTASHCMGFPDDVAKMTTCTGDIDQELFDSLTKQVGLIVQGE